MTMIICYAKCWPCTFAERKADHPDGPHTWMDDEDIEARPGAKQPKTPEEWAELAKTDPCGCWCRKSGGAS